MVPSQSLNVNMMINLSRILPRSLTPKWMIEHSSGPQLPPDLCSSTVKLLMAHSSGPQLPPDLCNSTVNLLMAHSSGPQFPPDLCSSMPAHTNNGTYHQQRRDWCRHYCFLSPARNVTSAWSDRPDCCQFKIVPFAPGLLRIVRANGLQSFVFMVRDVRWLPFH